MKRIRSRLIAAFVVIALLPAVPLSFVVRDLLGRSSAPRLPEEVSGALAAAIEESRTALRAEKERFAAGVADVLAGEVRDGWLIAHLEGDRLVSGQLPREIEAWVDGKVPESPDAATPDRVGSYLAARIRGDSGNDHVVALGLDSAMVSRAEKITSAAALLEGLRVEQKAVLQSYVLPFLLAYGLLIFIAIGAGTLLAAHIAGPIERLLRGVRRVAGGNLETRVVPSSSGEIRGLEESFNHMVEELSSQREELARLERKAAWRDLARALAHEIKNPLTPIQLAVQELGDRYNSGDGDYADLLSECVEIVNEEVESLRSLVREFSEFARLPEPKPRLCDLRETCREMVRLYGEDRVRFDDSTDAIPAWADESEIRRVLINLIDNGLAACETAAVVPTVSISLGREADRAILAVEDRGSGIGPDHVDKIFEPHFSTKSNGMGLGLAIVEGIIVAHEGKIEVDRRRGGGSRFSVYLPGNEPKRGNSEAT